MLPPSSFKTIWPKFLTAPSTFVQYPIYPPAATTSRSFHESQKRSTSRPTSPYNSYSYFSSLPSSSSLSNLWLPNLPPPALDDHPAQSNASDCYSGFQPFIPPSFPVDEDPFIPSNLSNLNTRLDHSNDTAVSHAEIPFPSACRKRRYSEQDDEAGDDPLSHPSFAQKRQRRSSHHNGGPNRRNTEIIGDRIHSYDAHDIYLSFVPSWSRRTTVSYNLGYDLPPTAKASSTSYAPPAAYLPLLPGPTINPNHEGTVGYSASRLEGCNFETPNNTGAKVDGNFSWDADAYLETLLYPTNELDCYTSVGPSGVENSYNATSLETNLATPFPRLRPTSDIWGDKYATAPANNAALSSVDFGQHHKPTNEMSTAGYIAKANMPNACMPPTRAVTSVDPAETSTQRKAQSQQSSSISLSVCQNPKPKNRKITKSTLSKELYTRFKAKDKLTPEFHCRYNGPAKPDGCSAIIQCSLRNFTRHVKIHARKEIKMGVSQDKWVALGVTLE